MSSRKKKAVPATWSEWSWDASFNRYYRARLDNSGKWMYEYKNELRDSAPVPSYGNSYISESSTQPLYGSRAGVDRYSDQRIPTESSSSWNSNMNYSQSSGGTVYADADAEIMPYDATVTQNDDGLTTSYPRSNMTSYAQDAGFTSSYTSSIPSFPAVDAAGYIQDPRFGPFYTAGLVDDTNEGTEDTEYLASSMASMRVDEKGKGIPQSPGGMAEYNLPDPSTYPRISPSDRGTKYEEFDTLYKVHPPKSFPVGRVFKTLVPPDSDEVALAEHLSKPGPGRNGGVIIMAVRRFVVIETQKHSNFFTALPIIVYTEQNPLPRHEERNHAIIYTEEAALERTHKHKRTKELLTPLRVVRDTPRDKLDANSKLDYGKPFQIDYEAKVCFLGTIHQISKKQLAKDWRHIVEGHENRGGEEWANGR